MAFQLGSGWKGLVFFFGLGALFVALIVLGIYNLSKNNMVLGVGMLVAAVVTAFLFFFVHTHNRNIDDLYDSNNDNQSLRFDNYDDDDDYKEDSSVVHNDVNDDVYSAATQYSKRTFDNMLADIAQAEEEALKKIIG